MGSYLMLDLRLAARAPRAAATVALAVAPPSGVATLAPASSVRDDARPGAGEDDDETSEPAGVLPGTRLPADVDPDELAAYLDEAEHRGKAASVRTWLRPRQPTTRLLLAGVGERDEAAWRATGAALTRKAKSRDALVVVLPAGLAPHEVRGLAEGLWLASYRFRLGDDEDAPKLRRVTLVLDDADDGGDLAEAFEAARLTVRMTAFARDLTNSPSDRKTPDWIAREVTKAARGIANLSVTVRDPDRLAAEGFGGLLAVGGGSARGPRLVELAWRPRGATRHVVLVGKGITFDTGGICVKTREGMKLMRKDMGGAAAVAAATIGAAMMRLPVRVTALLPLAENMLSGTAMRPGDVVRHYGGITSEVRNTDAEGRLVLADALAYADRRLRPDLLIDLATLTGAQSVALGKRTAALFSEDDALAKGLADAADDAGEKTWRMPLHEDYVESLFGPDTDLLNATDGGAGAVFAALFLREFVGGCRDRWAHIDMSAPAWSDSSEGELAKGATGWGVRTLLRWLSCHARPL
jgi:leucyl aminopeptidase